MSVEKEMKAMRGNTCIGPTLDELNAMMAELRKLRTRHMSETDRELACNFLATIDATLNTSIGKDINQFIMDECVECLHSDGCELLTDMILFISRYNRLKKRITRRLQS